MFPFSVGIFIFDFNGSSIGCYFMVAGELGRVSAPSITAETTSCLQNTELNFVMSLSLFLHPVKPVVHVPVKGNE